MDNLVLQSLEQRAETFEESSGHLRATISSEYKVLLESITATVLSLVPKIKSIYVGDAEYYLIGVEFHPYEYVGELKDDDYLVENDLMRGRWFSPDEYDHEEMKKFFKEDVGDWLDAMNLVTRVVTRNANTHQMTYGVQAKLIFDRSGVTVA